MIAGAGPACPGSPRPPPFTRRLACMVYEAVLLFGVVMIAGLAYAALAQQRHALQGSTGLQAVVFMVLAGYFVVFWSRGGQTLPMRTWQLRVVRRDGAALSPGRAFVRYLFSWLWFLPALASVRWAGTPSAAMVFVALLAGMAAYLLLARLRTDRQFLHDVVAGTRLVDLRASAADAALPAQSAR
jgi:uncharacterized RDD family membrane protein YckC